MIGAAFLSAWQFSFLGSVGEPSEMDFTGATGDIFDGDWGFSEGLMGDCPFSNDITVSWLVSESLWFDDGVDGDGGFPTKADLLTSSAVIGTTLLAVTSEV